MRIDPCSRATRQPHVRADPRTLFPSPPRLPDSPLKVIKRHGHSTTQDREPVSDGYTA